MNDSRYPSVYNQQPADVVEDIQRSFIMRVYAWMMVGMAVTAGAALFTLVTPGLLQAITTNRFLFLGLMVAELGLVVVLSAAINRLQPLTAGLLFTGYAALNGVTLSILFLVYTSSSIAITFGITACTFGIMSLFGYTTHRDLTRMGSLLFMALIGLLLASLANLFLHNPAIYWITTYLGVLIFTGLVAYDTQRLKKMATGLGNESELASRASILGALMLYLDFINLFLMLLRLLGKRN